LHPSRLAAEAYTENAEVMNLRIAFEDNVMLANAFFQLYQNRPNPFKEETLIAFALPEASSATLTLYDVSGRVIKRIEGEYDRGYHEIVFNRNELGNGGMMYYQLDTPNHSATKKLIMIE